MIFEKELKEADEFISAKKYKDALLIYDGIVNKISNPPADLMKKYAICLQERLRYSESLKITDDLLNKNPDDTDMLLNRCICLGKQDKHKEAISQYEKILEIDKNYLKQIGYYAYLLERTDSSEKAEYYYKLAIEYEPDNLWYISHFAFFLQKLKRYSEAEVYYNEAIKRDSENTWLIKRYVIFISLMKGKEAAYLYYDNLIKGEPTNCNYYINLSELAIINDDRKKALELLDKADGFEKPLVMELILLFYRGVYFASEEDYESLDNTIEKIGILRPKYLSYIHRDFTDLNRYINTRFNDRQLIAYKRIMNSLN